MLHKIHEKLQPDTLKTSFTQNFIHSFNHQLLHGHPTLSCSDLDAGMQGFRDLDIEPLAGFGGGGFQGLAVAGGFLPAFVLDTVGLFHNPNFSVNSALMACISLAAWS